MNYRLFCLSVITLICAGCGQKTPVGDVSPEFYFRGAPIDPACFMDAAAQVGDDAISLTVCTGKNKSQPEYKQNHFYGVEIDDTNGGVSSSYAYYRYIGKIGNEHVIQTILSPGGVGQYSSLRLMSLDGNLMHTLHRFASGDRCNGGITEASISGDKVSYSKNITPADLPALANGNEANFERGSDLSGDAGDCIGTADYEGEELKSVTLTMEPKEFPATQTPKGACFVGVYKEMYKPGTVLDQNKLSDLGIDLNTHCGPLNKSN